MGSMGQHIVCTSCGSKFNTMNHSSTHLSNEDRLFMAMPPARPSPVFSLTVVGGKVVATSQGQFPVNGQQLTMQVDRLTSAMMDMQMDKDEDMQEVNGGCSEQNLNSWTFGSNCVTQQQILQQQLLLEQQQQQTYQLQQQKQHEHQLQQYGQLQQEQQR